MASNKRKCINPIDWIADANHQKRLEIFNRVVGSLHLLFSIWVFIDYFVEESSKALKLPIILNRIDWRVRDGDKNCGESGNCFFSIGTDVENTPGFPIIIFVALFHLISASWLLVYPKASYENMLKSKTNWARWLEYSISAPIMSVIVAVTVGQMDTFALVALATIVFAMMIFGYEHEKFLASLPTGKRLKEKLSVAHVAGWVLFVIHWSLLAWVQYKSLYESEVSAPKDIKSMVWAIFASQLVFYFIFGLIQFLHTVYAGKESKDNNLFRKVEVYYTLASLTSKVLLGLLVYFTLKAFGGSMNLKFEFAES